jgi:hypothetical protein
MASAGMLQPSSKVLVATNTVTATGQSASFSMPVADCYRLILVVGTVSGTNPTFDAVLQDSPDGGTTWVNLPLRFTQVTATGTAATNPYIIFKPIGLSDAASAGVTAATGGASAANTPFNAKNVRLAYTVGGTATPTFPFTLYANMVGRGETAS